MPWLGVAELKTSPLASGIVTITSVAWSGPVFCTVVVKLQGWPLIALEVGGATLTDRSSEGEVGTTSVVELLSGSYWSHTTDADRSIGLAEVGRTANLTVADWSAIIVPSAAVTLPGSIVACCP